MLRITRLNGTHTESNIATTLRLEGRLTVGSRAEFLRACAPFLASPQSLLLDLGGLMYLDEAALGDLRRLRGQGVHLMAASPFIEQLLKESGT